MGVSSTSSTGTPLKPKPTGEPRLALDAIFRPRSVAVIGATEAAGTVGRTILWNLISNPFGGTVFPVNAKRSNVLGIRAYKSVAELPEVPDLAVVVTQASSVPGVIAECGEIGVPGAIVISAGFRETGESGAELERQLLASARHFGVRVIGPNCLGVMSPVSGLNATFAAAMARPGNVGFISQSGALCTAVLDWSFRESVGFSHFVSIGSMVDVGWGDLIDYLGNDARTRSIVIYMESIGDARSFMSAAREVALSKPIIVIKAGRTSAAAKAAASHTGALTGSDEVLDAAFHRCGVLRVDTIAELFYMAEVLSKQPRPRGPRLTILTNAGGPGVLATDALIANGGQLTEMAEDTASALNALLPPHWSHGNPVDVLGDAGPERYAKALEIAAKDTNSDGLLVILTPQAMTDPTQTAEQIKAFAKPSDKPVLASWMGGPDVAAGEAILNRHGVPTFPYPDTAARMFALMWGYSRTLKALYETPALTEDGGLGNGRKQTEAILQGARASGRTVLTDVESRQVLQAYGIPTVESDRAEIAGEACHELILGSAIDPQLGPVLLFGQGGKLLSVYKDRALGLPPLNTTLARRVMEQTRVLEALKGVRGERAVDLDALEHLLVRFSQMICEQRWIKEIDINPLLASPDRLLALNARVVVHGRDVQEADLPRLSIRPYPTQYIGGYTTKKGVDVLVRPIRPEDEPLMVKFHETLSERSVYFRYFHMMKLGQRVAHDRLARICFIDYDRDMALVAEIRDANNHPAIVGVGRLTKQRGTNVGEFAVTISDTFQGSGLGTELLRRVVDVGRREGLDAIVADILPDNRDMQRVSEKVGFRCTYDGEENIVRAHIALR